MSVGIVLVHGYTGSPDNLKPLAQQLTARYGKDSVINVCLSNHDVNGIPLFNKDSFIESIKSAVYEFKRERRKIILLGHSTGGIFTLSFILKYSFVPHLLILASAPKRIDASYIEKWNKHRSGKGNISFTSIADMVSLINFIGSQKFKGKFPVLIIHGEQDELVPVQEVLVWKQGGFNSATRSVIIPSARHDIFCGENSVSAIDVVLRAVSDIAITLNSQDRKVINKLSETEHEVRRFFAVSPLSKWHLSRGPGGRGVAGCKPRLSPVVKNEPVLANIEITTRCNLQCRYCARSTYSRQAYDMPREMFSALLDMIPHAYRITIVGLGEPLLHSHIVDFVAEASSRGRRVAMVSNAMCLDMSLSKELIRAGLHSIAFSIDGPDQESSSDVRRGSDFNKVIVNIKKFTEISEAAGRSISTAVFSAVSKKTVSNLQQLVDVVSSLGVKVLMLTDLNFRQNLKDTLWKNADDNIEAAVQKAVVYAFSKELPVLSVHGLEEFDLAGRYKEFLLLLPTRLYGRSSKHTWCFSPWQTIPVDVHGNITLCDCQPENTIGNLFTQPFSEIWNGEAMVEYRQRMLSSNPPETCKICPRF